MADLKWHFLRPDGDILCPAARKTKGLSKTTDQGQVTCQECLRRLPPVQAQVQAQPQEHPGDHRMYLLNGVWTPCPCPSCLMPRRYATAHSFTNLPRVTDWSPDDD